jgi:hypothetical protein
VQSLVTEDQRLLAQLKVCLLTFCAQFLGLKQLPAILWNDIIILLCVEERSRIAREIRLAARKEKKKAKSDAKKARKLNGILTRRAVSFEFMVLRLRTAKSRAKMLCFRHEIQRNTARTRRGIVFMRSMSSVTRFVSMQSNKRRSWRRFTTLVVFRSTWARLLC